MVASSPLEVSPVTQVAQPAFEPVYDLVIRGGSVLDGAGNPWIYADLAIHDGRFVAIGEVSGHGRQEINARGLFVSPGWIDMMDQSQFVLSTNGLAENKLLQGVTTGVAGEGGMPVTSDRVAEYLSSLERSGVSLNFGCYFGACQVREEVMGDVDGRPTAQQMEAMRARVADAMAGGALGLATALIYPPHSFQQTDELVALCEVAARRGGIFALHMRDESSLLLDGIAEAIEIGERANCQVEIFHFKAAYAPGWGKLVTSAGAAINDARARGVNIAADMYVYAAGGTGLSITVPNWLFDGGPALAMERLRDPKVREQLKREVAAGSSRGWSNLVEASGGWDRVVLANPHNAKYDQYNHQSIAQIASKLGVSPEDAAWDIVLEALPERAMALFFMMDEGDVETALRWPWMSIGSDAGAALRPGGVDQTGLPHPRAYGTFPRVIAEYVRKRGVLTLEDAIRKMTSWPASRMRFFDRGLIREGLRADVTVFDLETIQDLATYENPTLPPRGIKFVIVNGVLVVDDGVHTGARPGHILKANGTQCATGQGWPKSSRKALGTSS